MYIINRRSSLFIILLLPIIACNNSNESKEQIDSEKKYSCEYYSNGEKKSCGTWIGDHKIGWFEYFDSSSGRLTTLRSYILYRDTNVSRLNEVISFDKQGDTLYGESFFYRLYHNFDTIQLGDIFAFRIDLVAPIFESAFVSICDYDERFRLKNDTPCDTFWMNNFTATKAPKEYSLGWNIFRGEIVNVKEDMTNGASLFFVDSFYVVPTEN